MAQARARISKTPEVRREEFLSVALEAFNEVGYEKTSVQTITDRVGVAKGLFYHYFESKADLLNQLTAWQAEKFASSLPQHASEMQGGALDKLREVASRALQWKFEEIPELTRTYLEVMYSDENRLLRMSLMNESSRRLAPLFVEIVAEGVSEGVCQVDDPQIAVELLFGMGIGLGDWLAEPILALPEHPENLPAIVARLRGWESAFERVLGMAPGSAQFYDFEYVTQALNSLVGPRRPSAVKGES